MGIGFGTFSFPRDDGLADLLFPVGGRPPILHVLAVNDGKFPRAAVGEADSPTGNLVARLDTRSVHRLEKVQSPAASKDRDVGGFGEWERGRRLASVRPVRFGMVPGFEPDDAPQIEGGFAQSLPSARKPGEFPPRQDTERMGIERRQIEGVGRRGGIPLGHPTGLDPGPQAGPLRIRRPQRLQPCQVEGRRPDPGQRVEVVDLPAVPADDVGRVDGKKGRLVRAQDRTEFGQFRGGQRVHAAGGIQTAAGPQLGEGRHGRGRKLGGPEIPRLDPVRRTRRHQSRPGGYGGRMDVSRMAQQRRDRFPGGRIPRPDKAVVVACDDEASVGTEMRHPERALSEVRPGQGFPRRRIPDDRGRSESRRDEATAIRAPLDPEEIPAVLERGHRLPAGPGVP